MVDSDNVYISWVEPSYNISKLKVICLTSIQHVSKIHFAASYSHENLEATYSESVE